jgi:hypothetical protein
MIIIVGMGFFTDAYDLFYISHQAHGLGLLDSVRVAQPRQPGADHHGRRQWRVIRWHTLQQWWSLGRVTPTNLKKFEVPIMYSTTIQESLL